MPDTLGRFRILEPLGTDFIGSRYLAFDPQINRQVVLRTLDPASEDAGGLVREHFLQEARTAARLSHPNIIKVFGIHTEEPQPFVVLENLEGPSLELLLAETGPLSAERTVRLIGPVADALHYAHSEGVIHRDIRPGAIVVLPGDQPVLTGFLMAKMADLVSAVTRQGLAVGTPGYASPELVTGGSADLRGDIFSLGAVIYEVITGRQAFVGQNLAETLYRLAHADPDPPSSMIAGLDGRHDRLVLRALAKSPDQRQQSMAEIRTELETWLVSSPVASATPDRTDETTSCIGSSGYDDTDRLPALDPLEMIAASPGAKPDAGEQEPGPEPEAEPGPVATSVAPAAVGEAVTAKVHESPDLRADSKNGGGAPVPRARSAKRQARRGERPKLVAIIGAAAAVLLVLLLAVWQFGWLGSSPAGESAGTGEELPAPAGQLVDADPVGSGEQADDLAGEETDVQRTEAFVEEPAGSEEPPSEVRREESTGIEKETGSVNLSDTPLGGPAIPPPLPTGVLEVASLPWARVTLDGASRGETPLRIDGVAEGEHRLSLVSAAGVQWTGTVTVRGNRSTYHFHNFREDG